MLDRLLPLAARFALVTLAGAALHVGTARAGEYNLRGSYLEPPGSYGEYAGRPAPPIWTGLYLGGHLGGGRGEAGLHGTDGSVDIQGFAGGIHGGYNYQRGGTLFGLEADATWSGAGRETKFGTAVINVGAPWVSSARGRLGLVQDNWLFFVTGGAGLGDHQVSVKGAGSALPARAGSKTDVGYVMGGGVETLLTPRLSARAEILRYGMADFHPAAGSRDGLDFSVLRAGLSWQLNR